jgi:hypothetical protein
MISRRKFIRNAATGLMVPTLMSEVVCGSVPLPLGFWKPVALGSSGGASLTLPVTTGILMRIDVNAPNIIWKDTSRTVPATTTGDVVQGVTDLSGNNNHWSQAVSGDAPTLKFISGKKVLYFPDSTDSLSFASRMTTIRTVFWVIGRDGGAGCNGYKTMLGDSSNYNFVGGPGYACFDPDYSSVIMSQIRIDKTVAGIYAQRPLSPDIKVVTAQTSVNSAASIFSKDRTNSDRNWCGDLALLIAYDFILTTQQLSDTEDAIKAYLSV